MIVRLCVLFLTSVYFLAAGSTPSLQNVQKIYLLSMNGGLDQFLANRLTKGGQFTVTTDPEQADAIFTDRIGASLEQRLTDLYPPPPKEEPAAEDKDEADKKDADANALGFTHEAAPARISSFGKGKGNVFLIDRATRQVLWSDYKLPKNSQAPELNHIADTIIDKLQRDAKKGVKATVATKP